VNSLRMIGGAVGLAVGIGVAMWLEIVLAAAWSGTVFWAFVLGALRCPNRFPHASLTRPSIWEHKPLIQFGPVNGSRVSPSAGRVGVSAFRSGTRGTPDPVPVK